MSFFEGLVGGIAQGASRTIGTILDKRQEEASAARKYMQQRNIQKSEQYEAEKAEMEGLMKGFAEITGNDLDKAAQLIKGAGSIERANARLEMLTSERLKNENFDVNKLYTFAQRETNSDSPYTIGEYIENLVSRPTLATMPESKKFGLGLADKFFPKAQEIALPERTGREFDIGTASMMPGKTTAAEEFRLQQESSLLSIEQQRANLKKTLREANEFGAVPVTQVKQSFANIVASGLTENEIPASVDTSGNVTFELKNVKDKLKGIQSSYTTALKSVTEDAISTNALNTTGMKSILKTSAIQTLPYVEETLPALTDPNNAVAGEMYKTKAGIILYTGKGGLEENDYILIKKFD